MMFVEILLFSNLINFLPAFTVSLLLSLGGGDLGVGILLDNWVRRLSTGLPLTFVCTELLTSGDEEEVFSLLLYGENLADLILSAMMEGRRPEEASMLV